MRRPSHELCPTTYRPAWQLARRYGFSGAEAMAKSLPAKATAVDFGAGKSRLGLVMATKRLDVSWFNVDLRYDEMPSTEKRRSKAPDNLHYATADVLDPTTFPVEPGSVDRVYSNGLLPHMPSELAVRAVINMANLLGEDGELALAGFSNRPWHDAIHLSAEEYQADPEGSAQAIAGELSLGPVAGRIQVLSNLVTYHTIGRLQRR